MRKFRIILFKKEFNFMKKSLALLLASLTVSSAALADPSIVTIVFTCPSVTGAGPTVLTNFGARIAGYGTETIDGTPSFNSPYFSGTFAPGANIPANITSGSYTSSATGFDPTNGLVSCSYTSSTTFAPFTVTYEMVNAGGTQVQSSTASTITLNQFVGVKGN
jgi:hypothetical protein